MKLKKPKATKILSAFLSLAFMVALSSQAGARGFDPELPSLKEIYEDYFLVGSVFSPWDFRGERYDLILHQFNALTAENAMKPDAMQKNKGEFTFGQVDAVIKDFDELGISLHGHTLAWHSQSPEWLNKGLSRDEAAQNLLDHVNGVAGHYSGKVISWDVLNEAMGDGAEPSDWRSSLRKSDWYNAFANGGNGWDYIDFVFRAAREAAPDAILYYNDYNLNNSAKAGAVAAMVKELNDAYLAEGNTRLLIEGVGMQGHYSTNTVISSVEESIKLFRDIGVEVSISELDVTVSGAAKSGLTASDEIRQGIVYAQLFELFKRYSDVIARVTFWGVDDATSWRADNFPLLFNRDLSAKQAFYAVADPEKYLAENALPETEKIAQPRAKAAYGTPVIDGVREDSWYTAEEIPVNQMLQAWQTASGTARALWDENNIYILFEVTDNTPDDTSTDPWQCDSVEAFIDETNCKKGTYAPDDGQYRVTFKNKQSFGNSTSASGFDSAVSAGNNSYIVEMKIPLKTIDPEPGAVLGFDLQINDAFNGFRMGIAMWNDITGDSWQNTTMWGELVLLGDGREDDIDDLDPALEASAANSEVSGGGISSGMIVAIILTAIIAARIGWSFIKKKQKR